MQSSRPVFFVSTGRSGSRMIAQALGQHPMICGFHEPLPLLNTLAYVKWRGAKDRDTILAKLHLKRNDLIQQVMINR